MSDNTPNSLTPTKKISVVKMSKWPMYAVMLAGLFLVAVLVYSVNFAHDPQKEEDKNKRVDIKEEEKPLIMGEGRGLALAPPAGSPAISGPPATPVKSAKNEPLIIVQGGKEQSDPYRQELENIRRMKAQVLSGV